MAARPAVSARDRATRGPLIGRTIVVLLIVGAAVASVLLQPVRLGLDLRGGTQIVLEARETADQPVDGDTVERTLEVLRRRVDSLGVSEPTLQRSGERRILVELPGVTDPEEALAVIGRTAQLTFHPVLGYGDPEGDDPDDALVLPDNDGVPLVLAPMALSGNDVAGAGITIAQQGIANRFNVTVDFRGTGPEQWRELTAAAACAPTGSPQRRVAIVLDDTIISSPQVVESIVCGLGMAGGNTEIMGNFTREEADELALLIRAGALPVPVEVVEQRTIGPTLGQAAIEASLLAAIIGVVLTLLFMVAAYRLFGLVAGLALALYGLLSFAALTALGATLTLPGIAGFVLAVGMAVDANVLVFERAKEEHAAGRSVRSATSTGFQKALTAVVDSNVTTIIAAVLLIFLASGAVRGFGVTVTIGVIVSMFSALVVTRVVLDWLLRIPALARRVDVLGLTAWRRLRVWLDERQPDLMGRAAVWALRAAALVAVLAIAGMLVRGFNWGLEFTGGRLLEYRTERIVDVDALRSDLLDAGVPSAVVQSTADDQVAVRTSVLADDQEQALLEALQAHGGRLDVVRDEFIGPTIGSELRRNGIIALVIALTGQLIYLAIRFRWTYGTATILGMVHNVALLLGVFVWAGKSLDGVFLASLLTVVGYSINDTVVIFDRIREHRTKEPKVRLETLTNRALVQTLPRTVNTGMGALFILFALYFLGGDTLSDFALALILGTSVGMYSSIMVASPILMRLEGRWPRRDPPPGRRPTSSARLSARRSGGDSRAVV